MREMSKHKWAQVALLARSLGVNNEAIRKWQQRRAIPGRWHLPLLKAAKDHNSVLNHPAPSVMFKKVGEQGLEFDLRLFIPHIDHFVSVKHEMHNAINAAFREGGIRFFAFSHRNVDVRSIAAEVPGGFPVQGIE